MGRDKLSNCLLDLKFATSESPEKWNAGKTRSNFDA
jgi:hypothetical protein